MAGIATIRDQLAEQIVVDAESEADALQQETFLRIGVTLIALLLAALMALLLTRSITRRVRAVSDKAHEVATIQLPALVSALRDPRGRSVIPDVVPIEDAGTDELGELAGAFNVVQSTLVDVAHEQIEVLRRGVSDIFVTMARRTRSLIDRQLALLDELEADVDDPSVLANYYQLDHLATRMRRNSESLLVLANAESRRRRTKATDVDDVVRAAIGEVEDYRRIDVLNLDHLQVRGAVVADISHLLAELLDNASSFSPPESRVTVSGRYAGRALPDLDLRRGCRHRRRPPRRAQRHPRQSTDRRSVGRADARHVGRVAARPQARRARAARAVVARSPGRGRAAGQAVRTDRRDRVARRRAGDERSRHARTRPRHRLVGVGRARAPPTRSCRTSRPPSRRRRPSSRRSTPEWSVSAEVDPSVGHDVRRRDDRRVVHRRRRTGRCRAHVRARVVDRARSARPARLDGRPRIRSTTRRPWRHAPEVFEPEEPSRRRPSSRHPVSRRPSHTIAWVGEFDRPPAPPAFGIQPTSRPFTDPTARPIPARRTESDRLAASGQANSSLPTRSRGTGPDGPDRLAAQLTGPVGQPMAHGAPTAPSSLKAALSAFEAGRAGARPDASSPPALPTRDPGSAFDHDEVTASTSQSRLDPESIRERLRSFRQEFQLGRDGEGAAGHDGDQTDLGGDR